jgi:hypothetical protein
MYSVPRLLLYHLSYPFSEERESNPRPIDPNSNKRLQQQHITSDSRQYYGAIQKPSIRSAAAFCSCVINDDNTKVKVMCALFLRIRIFFLLFEKIS